MSGPEAVAAFVFFGGAFWVLKPLSTALAKRIAGEHRPAVAPTDSEDQEAILAELQQLRQEVAELQERMDFTERVVARGREGGDRLGPPKPG